MNDLKTAQSFVSAAFSTCLLAACLWAAGCRGPEAMKNSFRHYSEAYASLSNEQMLLNLARRANRHPAYFLQLGLINSTFVFNKNASLNMAWTSPTAAPVPGDVWNAGSGVALSATEQPTFSMTPLGGESFAAAIFNPLPAAVFFNMYEQSVPMNKLLRCMVQKVEFTWPDGSSYVLSNVIDRERPENYTDFLRLAGLARELQKQQILIVTNAPAAGSTNQRASAFAFKPGAEEQIEKLSSEHPYFRFNSNMAQSPAKARVEFYLGTFEGVLMGLATEQRVFEEYVRSRPDFLEGIPPSERQPILRLDWTGKEGKHTPPLVQLKYESKTYAIADEINGGREETWNRDVFVLLTHVFTEISLDPNKLPVQQLIQVR